MSRRIPIPSSSLKNASSAPPWANLGGRRKKRAPKLHQTPLPDQGLVYLNCSSIFNKANAQIRQQKKIVQVLSQHQNSIKTLTKDFSIEAIAAVVKRLLHQQIFDSNPLAKLHFPEFFQPSEAQEAEAEAEVSEAEVARLEAEAVQETVVTSDEELEQKILGIQTNQNQGPLPGAEGGTSDKDAQDALDEQRYESDSNPFLWMKQPQLTCLSHARTSTQKQDLDPIPRLHPVYLPFRTQHQILKSVQSMLEECCFEFGKSWLPEMMKVKGWEEVESVELNEWVKTFSSYMKAIPLAATKPAVGEELKTVIFGIRDLRHSAVHRWRTSAERTIEMLDTATNFTQALKDTERTAYIRTIRKELAVEIKAIVQNQVLLERKLSDQSKDFARRRAEIDGLERLAIEDMINNDKAHRFSSGSVIENFLTGLSEVLNTYSSERSSLQEYRKASSEVEEGTMVDTESMSLI
jgi:hypothetical protein